MPRTIHTTGLASACAVVFALLVPPPATAQNPTGNPAQNPAQNTAEEAPPPDSAFQKVTLNDTPGEPMDLAVLPDGRVLHTTRAGQVWMHDPDTGLNTRAGTVDVYQHDEEGLQSVAVDPGFGRTNNWVYLYYSPPLDTPVDDPATPGVNEGDSPAWGTPEDWKRFEGLIRLSRFPLKGDRLDLDAEQQILDVPVDRGICCHVGGDIVFDDAGNLYLSTGDDTNPFASNGYTPIDEREGRNPVYDAQRTSGNTDDLRGKILRIRPEADGGYTIPDGNLFERDAEDARPEVYVMGLRNPFRIEIDPASGELYVADYSPDARNTDPKRGPAGQGKWTVVRRPGNYGWPYCATAELPYVDYDFLTRVSGETFDCAAPKNDSPHNTGRRDLPPVAQPEVWYSYGTSPDFPELGTGGIGPMAGPAYRYDPAAAGTAAPVAWPKYYDGVPLFAEWTRDYVKAFHVRGPHGLSGIEPVVPSVVVDNPMDLEFGPDGALYVLEYGDGYFRETPEAQLARIDHIGVDGNHSPTPAAAADKTSGTAPLTVQFSSEGTKDADGDRLRYEWDFEADGRVDSKDAHPSFTYRENGVYRATLRVTDVGGEHRGRSATAEVRIVVGNAAPVVELLKPADGQPFKFGDAVPFEVRVTDDQVVDCADVEVTYILGHDQHGHPQTTAHGCSGVIQTTQPSGHDPAVDDLRAVFVASYTDPGQGDLPALTGTDQVVLEPSA